MARYVLFKKGGEPTDQEISRISNAPGLKILENDLQRLLLIEANPTTLVDFENAFPGWTIGAERFHGRPEAPRKTIKRGSDDDEPTE